VLLKLMHEESIQKYSRQDSTNKSNQLLCHR
jgi:hypothetical protein